MKNFLKALAITAIIMIVLIAVNVFCNMRGTELNTTATGTFTAIAGMYIYQAVTKGKDN